MNNRYQKFTNYILQISHAIFLIKTQEMKKYHLKSSDVSFLFFLYANGDNKTAAEICALSGEDKGAISRTVNHLIKEEYITYVDDKKYRARLSLTEKGNYLAQYINDRINEIFLIAGNGLSDQERNELYRLLDIICHNLTNISNQYGEINENTNNN